eukprot:TRINITY_DN4923_c0_g1_i1.p1 TRINITY_DN4923_c0_g1~~TRINITY_DN4923_c0_g1_i1.p1  ORF type:complete len:724 (-),score=142.73 TRINITY_DN4923_c0_g1_i1:72-2117(-)
MLRSLVGSEMCIRDRSICRVAYLGSISEPSARGCQSTLMTGWIFLQLITLVLAVFGLAVLNWEEPCRLEGTDNQSDDELVARWLLWVVVVWQLGSAVVAVALYALIPSSSGKPHLSQDGWSDKCRRVCRCLSVTSCGLFGSWYQGDRSGHGHNPYENAATVLWSLFGGQFREAWWTPSDIMVGLGLVRGAWLKKHGPVTQPPQSMGALHESQVSDLNERFTQFSYYSKYMLAVYGHLLFAWSELVPPMGQLCCGLLGYRKLGCCCNDGVVTGDNCFGCNKAAFVQRAGTDGDDFDLVYADFECDISRTPYGIVADYKKKAVVVTVRGTINLKDCLTDGLANPIEFKCAATTGRDPVYVHQGFYEAAMVIFNELTKSNILEMLTLDPDLNKPSKHDAEWLALHAPDLHNLVLGESSNCLPRIAPKCRGFKIVLVGHSLGAGVVAVLSALMYKRFVNLHGYAYSCPGAVFSYNFAKCGVMMGLVTSCVLADDMVARLSLRNVERIRDRIVNALDNCPYHKSEVFEALMDDSLELHSSELFPEWEESPVSQDSSDMMEMGVAGRILYLERVGNEREEAANALLLSNSQLCCGADVDAWAANLSVRWASQDEFLEIKPSPLMGLDHFPDRIHAALQVLSSSHLAGSQSYDVVIDPHDDCVFFDVPEVENMEFVIQHETVLDIDEF